MLFFTTYHHIHSCPSSQECKSSMVFTFFKEVHILFLTYMFVNVPFHPGIVIILSNHWELSYHFIFLTTSLNSCCHFIKLSSTSFFKTCLLGLCNVPCTMLMLLHWLITGYLINISDLIVRITRSVNILLFSSKLQKTKRGLSLENQPHLFLRK